MLTVGITAMFVNHALQSTIWLAVAFFSLSQECLAISRTYPPNGSVVVRAGTKALGEFATVTAAVNSLPNDTSQRSIFIYPGSYNEQVYISRRGQLTVRCYYMCSLDAPYHTQIYGYTTDIMSYSANKATIQAGVSAARAGSDDKSGTLRVHKNNFYMYNVNVKNTFGRGSQAIALSQYGSRVGLYACGFYGYQDTLLANQGTQVYLKNYIEVREPVSQCTMYQKITMPLMCPI